MFIKARERKNKSGEIVYYFYSCENYRQDGKVKTNQKYLFKQSLYYLKYDLDRLMNNYFYDLRKQNFEIWLKVITKIQFDILKDVGTNLKK